MRYGKPAFRLARCLVAVGIVCYALGGALPSWAQEKTVATVNGEAITQSDFFGRLEHLHGQDFLVMDASNSPKLRGETAGFLVMSILLNQRLILQYAAKNSAMPTEAEVAADLGNMMKQETVKQALAQKQVTEEELKTQIRVTSARLKLATKGVTVTNTEVEDWYNKHKSNYTIPERWGLSVILTSKQEDIPKIQKTITDLSFETAARTHSEDTRTSGNGGSMGIIFANDPRLPDAIRTAVSRLNVGEITTPIEIEFQDGAGRKGKVWWLLKLNMKEAQVVHPLSEVKQEAQQLAMLDKAGGFTATDAKIAEFHKQSTIKVNLPGYDALNNTPPKPPK